MTARGALHYALAVAVGCLAIVSLSFVSGRDNAPVGYVCALLAVCSLPLLFAARLNGRYLLLVVLMGFFFLFYGIGDVIALLEEGLVIRSVRQSEAEAGIVVGALVCALAYALVAGRDPQSPRTGTTREWPAQRVVVAGAVLWLVGVVADNYWQLFVLRKGWAKVTIGGWEGLIVTAGRYVHLLGIALVAYAAVTARRLLPLLLVLVVIGIEFVLGFVGDSKESAFRAGAVLVLARMLVSGRIPKLWIAIAIAAFTLAAPVFQAYRAVLQASGMERLESAGDLDRQLDRAMNTREYRRGEGLQGSFSFLERASLKGTFLMTVDRVGKVGSFQDGKTLRLYFTGFIPRFLWPDKPAAAAGQLFNEDLRITVPGVYISVSLIGEFYWNYGWPGVVIGMSLLGAFMGFIGRRFSLAERPSVTSFLVVTVTIYLVCLRFEDNFAMTFIMWTRSMAAIGILHLLLATPSRRPVPAATLLPDKTAPLTVPAA